MDKRISVQLYVVTCAHTCTHTHTHSLLHMYCVGVPEWCGVDEGVEVVCELVEEVAEIAFSIVYSHYLEQQAFPHSVSDAKHSLLKIIEVMHNIT